MFFNSPDLNKYRQIGAQLGADDLSDTTLLALWSFLHIIAARPETYPLNSDAEPLQIGSIPAADTLNSDDKEASPRPSQ